MLARLCVGIRSLHAGEVQSASIAFQAASQTGIPATQLLSAAVRTGLSQTAGAPGASEKKRRRFIIRGIFILPTSN